MSRDPDRSPVMPVLAAADPVLPTIPVSPPVSTAPDDGLEWGRVWAAVKRFKWLIFAAAVLGCGLGVVASRLVPPVYLAQATIWIDESDRRAATDRGPMGPTHLLDPEAWVDLLRSFEVLEDVVRDQRLYLGVERPADTAALTSLTVAADYRPGSYRLVVDSSGGTFALLTREGAVLERGTVGDSIGRPLGLVWAPGAGDLGAGRTVDFTVSSLRDRARLLSDELDVKMDAEGNFLRLGLSGSDPVRITAIANAIVQRYVAVAADLKRRRVTELTKILDQQLGSARDNLHTTEVALERFGVNTIVLPSEAAAARAPAGAGRERDPATAGYFDLQLQLDAVRRDRETLLRVIAQAGDSGISASALEEIEAVRSSPEMSQALKELVGKQADLRALRYRYAEAYPPLQRLATDLRTLERQTIPSLGRTLATQLATQEAELTQRLEAGSRTLRQIPPRAIEEGRLRRAVTLAENVYTTLQQRYEEARIAEASTLADVRVLDAAATPRRPLKNTAPHIILLAGIASLGLAVIGAVLLDRVDPRVRYPEQISRDMGLTILGTVPHLRRRRGKGAGGAGGAETKNGAEIVEALRGVCLNLSHAYGSAGPMLVTVTSPGPGDGKSFLSANLAHTFAEGGHRTLLVDADVRRGVLHRRFGRSRRPGLSDFIRGDVTLDAIVQSTEHHSLSLIGCGLRAHNAPELLGSSAMAQLVTWLRNRYDVVIFDCPPLAAGVDPLIVGTLTGSLMLVLRTGYSHRDLTAGKLEVLHRFPVRLLGAVLNDVPEGAMYRTYSYYLPGYEAGEEDARAEPVVL